MIRRAASSLWFIPNQVYLIFTLFLLVSCQEFISNRKATGLMNKAVVFMRNNQNEEAIELLYQILKLPELNSELKGTASSNLALSSSNINKNDSAIKYYKLAADCYQANSFGNKVNVANVNLPMGATKQALKNLELAYKEKPSDLTVNNSLGLIYLGIYGEEYADYNKALDYNLKAFELENSCNTGITLALNHMYLEEYAKAEKIYLNYQHNYHYKAYLYYQLGAACFGQDKLEEANQYWEIAIQEDPEYESIVDSIKHPELYEE